MNRNIDTILESPVFIIGCPRSGTTWVQRLLLSHPAICGGQESSFFDFFGPLASKFRFEERNGTQTRRVGLSCYWDFESFRHEILRFWKQTFRGIVEGKPSASLLLEKTPQHAMHIANITEYLPTARFIHVIRDSRAVVASLLAARRDGWGSHWAPRSARDAAILWYHYVTTVRRDSAGFGAASYTEVRYEDLKRSPVAEVERLLGFLGLDASPEQVGEIVAAQDFERQKRLGGTPLAGRDAVAQSEPQGFFRRGEVDSWRRELGLLQKATVWRYTRRLMWEVGYTWEGRLPQPNQPACLDSHLQDEPSEILS